MLDLGACVSGEAYVFWSSESKSTKLDVSSSRIRSLSIKDVRLGRYGASPRGSGVCTPRMPVALPGRAMELMVMGDPSSRRSNPTKAPSGLPGLTSATVCRAVNLLESEVVKSPGWIWRGIDPLRSACSGERGDGCVTIFVRFARAGRGGRGRNGGGDTSSADSVENLWILSSNSRARAFVAALRASNLASSYDEASI